MGLNMANYLLTILSFEPILRPEPLPFFKAFHSGPLVICSDLDLQIEKQLLDRQAPINLKSFQRSAFISYFLHLCLLHDVYLAVGATGRSSYRARNYLSTLEHTKKQ